MSVRPSMESFPEENTIVDRSALCGPRSHSERPMGSEVRGAGLTPTDRFSGGESGPHCT